MQRVQQSHSIVNVLNEILPKQLSQREPLDELKHLKGLKAIRINARINIPAIDSEAAGSCSALPALHSLCGVTVHCMQWETHTRHPPQH